jgi:hypothetical protein
LVELPAAYIVTTPLLAGAVQSKVNCTCPPPKALGSLWVISPASASVSASTGLNVPA